MFFGAPKKYKEFVPGCPKEFNEVPMSFLWFYTLLWCDQKTLSEISKILSEAPKGQRVKPTSQGNEFPESQKTEVQKAPNSFISLKIFPVSQNSYLLLLGLQRIGRGKIDSLGIANLQ